MAALRSFREQNNANGDHVIDAGPPGGRLRMRATSRGRGNTRVDAAGAAVTHCESPDIHDEYQHEVAAALLGIEAAARGLSRHRELLTTEQFDELCDGLAAEVHRLRLLITGQRHERSTFDLLDAIKPVMSCARADGMDVRSTVPPATAVEGGREATAQVLLALLTNAKQHAPGAPVELKTVVDERQVRLYVEDHGPGIAKSLRDRVFEPGVRSRHSGRSGFGLSIARRLMAEQDGSIELNERSEGGGSFVLQFRRPSTTPPAAPFPSPTVAPR